jgi:hypothetical protein
MGFLFWVTHSLHILERARRAGIFSGNLFFAYKFLGIKQLLASGMQLIGMLELILTDLN